MEGCDPVIHVVVPHYNGVEVLCTCLSSLKKQTVRNLQISVVDNGSTDGSVSYLKAEWPEVNCLEFHENKGFSAAVNAGIQNSSGQFVFLLNNDTELRPDALEQLLATACKLPEFVFFVPKMLSFNQRTILDGAGDGYLRGGAGYRLGTMEEDCEHYNKPGPVFGACAGAVLYRRTLFDRVGLFDEDFFAYLEDVDLNLRINRAGLRGYYVPSAVVYHIGSATTGSKINAFTIRLSTRNSLYVLLKNYQLSLFIRFLPVICIYQFCWFLFSIKKHQFLPYCRGMFQAFASLLKMREKHHGLRRYDEMTVPEFALCLKRAEKDVIVSIMRRRSALGKGNRLLRMYCFFFL